ncbi:MAG TPA: hypothetical protein VGC97_03120 [Pyrinomonadaceae bacterium]|jgi:hypothetical protein
MAKKKLTIKGITFPNFGDDDSKKNFRLIFYIGYTDKDGNEAVETVTKPATGHWQWRKASKDAFLKPKLTGDSAELDTIVLKNGDGNKIPAGSNKIAEIDGEITDVTVQFMDVHDKTPIDFLVKSVLPELIEVWKASGFDPIAVAPVPGIIKGIIKDKVNLEELADQAAAFFKKKLKDKMLHSISIETDGENPTVLKEDNVEWGDDKKTGTYAVKIGVA